MTSAHMEKERASDDSRNYDFRLIGSIVLYYSVALPYQFKDKIEREGK